MAESDYKPKFLERFYRRVSNITDPDVCWEWTGPINNQGYGIAQVKRRNRFVHRIMYELHYGIQPGEKFVCHACDNPLCCNPHHLWLGTHRDNFEDMLSKGRHPRIKRLRDEKPNLTKFNFLSPEQILDIQALWRMTETSYAELAAIYKVRRERIRNIIKRIELTS